VSHDRAFLDNVVTQTIAHEGEGKWKEYVGGYSDWERMRAKPDVDTPAQIRPSPRPSPKGEGERRRKLTYNETRELEALPAKLEALEREQGEIAAKLADPGTYQDRTLDVRAMNARHEEIEAELTRLLARWEELESRA
jgi:ATP-binding cassette subfamily F protein uup